MNKRNLKKNLVLLIGLIGILLLSNNLDAQIIIGGGIGSGGGGGGGNPFNQSLNTTDSPSFENITIDEVIALRAGVTDLSYAQILSGDAELAVAGATYLGAWASAVGVTPAAAIDGFEGFAFTLNLKGTQNNAYQLGIYGRSRNQSSGTITDNYGGYFHADNSAGGAITNNYGIFADTGPSGGAGVTTNNYGVYSSLRGGSSTVTNAYQFYGDNIVSEAACPYFLWYNGTGTDAGVYRINHLGVPAQYNPVQADYTPCAANFERFTSYWGDTGRIGTNNILYVGAEAGGTGTLRVLTLIGASATFETTPGTKAAVSALTFQPTSNYISVDGTTGFTGTACTSFKNGLCVAGT